MMKRLLNIQQPLHFSYCMSREIISHVESGDVDRGPVQRSGFVWQLP